jgi:hypothetical protein
MQIPIDYRDFFMFSILQPLGVTEDCDMEEVFDHLYSINAIPLLIIDDPEHPLLKYNKEMLQKDLKTIIIAISYEHNPFIS